MTTQPSTNQLVIYTYEEDTEIHHFVFTQGTRAAVDQWLDHVDAIYERIDELGTLHVRALVDISNISQPSLPYAYNRAKEIGQKYTTLPPRRFVFIAQQSVFTSMVKTFINLLRSDVEYNFVPPEKRDDAIAWLLEE